MALKIDSPISAIAEVEQSEHNRVRVNSIKTRYPEERQESKTPTFALTRRSPFA